MEEEKIRLLIVGLLSSVRFQKSKYYADFIYERLPEIFEKPVYRAMLDVQWNKYLKTVRRNIGGRLWCSSKSVVIYKNGEYFGGDEDLCEFIHSKYGYYFMKINFEKLRELHLNRYLKSERTHIYFTITVNGCQIGSFLIQLYNDLVPLACANFIRLCELEQGGYNNCRITRVVKKNWIQFGGRKMIRDKIPCENYSVPHDQRGVVSMCNNGKHRKNTTQFFISLDPTPWMDYYYVAFGQVVHGDHVLKLIEELPTKYETPLKSIVVESCGEYKTANPMDQYSMLCVDECLCAEDIVTPSTPSLKSTQSYL